MHHNIVHGRILITGCIDTQVHVHAPKKVSPQCSARLDLLIAFFIGMTDTFHNIGFSTLVPTYYASPLSMYAGSI